MRIRWPWRTLTSRVRMLEDGQRRAALQETAPKGFKVEIDYMGHGWRVFRNPSSTRYFQSHNDVRIYLLGAKDALASRKGKRA